MAFFTANATTPEVSAAPCDNKCRQRFDFYFCAENVTKGKCITFAQDSCLLCVYGGLCQDKNDYTFLKSQCIPPNVRVEAVYHNECTPVCACNPSVQQVEATSMGPEKAILAVISQCRN
jgi:hypothetical protein